MELLGLIMLYLLFLLLCWCFYSIAVKVKSAIMVFIFTLVYLLGIYFYFEAFNQLHAYLRDKKILDIDFGHAGLDLILLMFFCYLNACVLIGFSVSKRSKISNV